MTLDHLCDAYDLDLFFIYLCLAANSNESLSS